MIINLTHYDLDGVTCSIVLHNTIGLNQNYCIGYSKIDEYLDIIDEHCVRNFFDTIYITDLKFEEYQLAKLQEISLKHNSKFIFIDHHQYSFTPSKYKSKNLTILVNEGYSASTLTYLYLRKFKDITIKDDLNRFLKAVNSYDLWQDDNKDFRVGFVYNELFWDYGKEHFYSKFKESFGIRANDKERYKKILEKKNEAMDKIKKSGKLFSIGSNDMLLIFTDKFMNFVTLDFPDYKTYVIVNSTGRISVRLNKNLKSQEEAHKMFISKIKDIESTKTVGGHTRAFGITLKDNNPSTLVQFTKKMMYIVDEVLVSIGER